MAPAVHVYPHRLIDRCRSALQARIYFRNQFADAVRSYSPLFRGRVSGMIYLSLCSLWQCFCFLCVLCVSARGSSRDVQGCMSAAGGRMPGAATRSAPTAAIYDWEHIRGCNPLLQPSVPRGGGGMNYLPLCSLGNRSLRCSTSYIPVVVWSLW